MHERLPLVGPARLLIDARVLHAMRDNAPFGNAYPLALVFLGIFSLHCFQEIFVLFCVGVVYHAGIGSDDHGATVAVRGA